MPIYRVHFGSEKHKLYPRKCPFTTRKGLVTCSPLDTHALSDLRLCVRIERFNHGTFEWQALPIHLGILRIKKGLWASKFEIYTVMLRCLSLMQQLLHH
jgi:hypothetical protein